MGRGIVGVLVCAMVFGLTAFCAAETESASLLLEKGLHTEETVGDLDTAINIYQKVVADPKAMRRCAAEAQYRLGICCEKKGEKAKALAAFKKVIENYADQTQYVLKARKKLPSGPEVPRPPEEVMAFILGEQMKTYGEAVQRGVHANVHIYGVDDAFNLHSGGMLAYRNTGAEPQAGPIHLGNFGPKKPRYVLVDETGRPQQFEVRERRNAMVGKWGLWWLPDQPVQPAAFRLLGYYRKGSQRLSQRE